MKARLHHTSRQIVYAVAAISLFALAPLASGTQYGARSSAPRQSADLSVRPGSLHPVLVMNRTSTGPLTDSILHLNVYTNGLVTVSRATFQGRVGPQVAKVQVVDFAFLDARVISKFQSALIAAGAHQLHGVQADSGIIIALVESTFVTFIQARFPSFGEPGLANTFTYGNGPLDKDVRDIDALIEQFITSNFPDF